MEDENVIDIEKTEPEIKPEIKIEDELICTCDKEKFPFVTTFCPVHPPEFTKIDKSEYGEDDSLVVTDADLVGYGQWMGYIFKCPGCGIDAIMVNPTMGKACTNCGQRIEVRSKTITAKIRSLSAKKSLS